MSEEIFITTNTEQTQELALDLAKKLKSGDFLAFFGDLGSGKTTFIQGLAKSLGVKRRIISPTFIIVRTYLINSGTFYHIDLYRTQSKDDLFGLGIDQIVQDKTSIVAIEWAEKMGDMLPQKRIELHFKNLAENKREIKIKKYE